MKILKRIDLVPIDYAHNIDRLTFRAYRCGLRVHDVLDVTLDGEHFKELLLTGTRWGYIKYWSLAILNREAELKAIPGIIKLMFMR